MMKKALFAASVVGMVCVSGASEAAVSRGSSCAKITVDYSCSGNTITGKATLTNCSKLSDTFAVTAKGWDPNGAIIVNEALSVPLGANKSFSVPVTIDLPLNAATGDYDFEIVADAKTGTALVTYPFTVTIPCN